MSYTLRDFLAWGEIRRLFPQLQRRLDLADAYQRTFASPEGQIVLRDLIREAGILEVAHDPTDSRFYDGRRALGLHILHRLRWSAAELETLGQEMTYEQLSQRERGEAA